MAHVFNTNSIPATGAACMYAFLAALITQTWTKDKDSDGTTYSSSGVQITGGGSGANGLANNSAWFVVRDPNGTRSFCFQRGTTNVLWRVKYSASAGFVGGSPSATQVPSATDEMVLSGAGSDAAPTYHTLFGADGTLRFNCCAGDATVGYGFWWLTFVAGIASSSNGMALEVMAAGSFPAADTDPAIVYVAAKGNGVAANAFGADLWGGGTADSCRGFLSNTHTLANFKECRAQVYHDLVTNTKSFPANLTSQGVGTNPHSSKDDGLPIPFARQALSTAPIGYKGFGSLLRWSGVFRANWDTVSNTGAESRDKIWFNGCLLPWDGSIASI